MEAGSQRAWIMGKKSRRKKEESREMGFRKWILEKVIQLMNHRGPSVALYSDKSVW